MKHGDEVWVRGTWKEAGGRGPYIHVRDKSDLYIMPNKVEWMPAPAVKDSLTAPDSPLMDQLSAEADLREREEQMVANFDEILAAVEGVDLEGFQSTKEQRSEDDDREFRDRCAVAAMHATVGDWQYHDNGYEPHHFAFDHAAKMVAERRRRDGR